MIKYIIQNLLRLILFICFSTPCIYYPNTLNTSLKIPKKDSMFSFHHMENQLFPLFYWILNLLFQYAHQGYAL